MRATALSVFPKTDMSFVTAGMLLVSTGLSFVVPSGFTAVIGSEIPYAGRQASLTSTAIGLEVGTGGTATVEYVRKRGNKGYPFFAYELPKGTGDARASRTPAQNLAHIRAVLKPRITDLATAMGVSRQALYDWQAGKAVASEHAARLADLAGAADVFALEGLTGSSESLHRAVRDGKDFFDLVREGRSANTAARTLIEVVRTELSQREALKNRLKGRKRPSREAFDEIGAPMLDERS